MWLTEIGNHGLLFALLPPHKYPPPLPPPTKKKQKQNFERMKKIAADIYGGPMLPT